MRFFWGWEIEDAQGFQCILGADRLEVGKVWVNWESGINNLMFREALLDKGVFGVLVSYQPEVGGGFSPSCVDSNRIGNNGKYWDSSNALVENTLDKIGVERVGAEDGVRFKF